MTLFNRHRGCLLTGLMAGLVATTSTAHGDWASGWGDGGTQAAPDDDGKDDAGFNWTWNPLKSEDELPHTHQDEEDPPPDDPESNGGIVIDLFPDGPGKITDVIDPITPPSDTIGDLPMVLDDLPIGNDLKDDVTISFTEVTTTGSSIPAPGILVMLGGAALLQRRRRWSRN